MSNPNRPRSARTICDFVAMSHQADTERYRWLAAQLRTAGMRKQADLAERWAIEHRTVAADLTRAGA